MRQGIASLNPNPFDFLNLSVRVMNKWPDDGRI